MMSGRKICPISCVLNSFRPRAKRKLMTNATWHVPNKAKTKIKSVKEIIIEPEQQIEGEPIFNRSLCYTYPHKFDFCVLPQVVQGIVTVRIKFYCNSRRKEKQKENRTPRVLNKNEITPKLSLKSNVYDRSCFLIDWNAAMKLIQLMIEYVSCCCL